MRHKVSVESLMLIKEKGHGGVSDEIENVLQGLLVKIKQPAVAVEVDRRQPKVALENVIRLRLITDSTRRWATR